MRLATLAITFTVLLAGSAHAGGNPDDNEPMGVMTREPLPQAAPVIPDQDEIKRKIEAEIFAEPQIPEGYLRAEKLDEARMTTPITIARAEPEGECVAVFEWLASALGGTCELNGLYADGQNAVGPDAEFETRDVITVSSKTKKFRTKHKARKFAKKARKKNAGNPNVTVTRNGKKVTITTTIVTPTLFQVESNGNDSGSGGTADHSNGMRGDDRDSGNW